MFDFDSESLQVYSGFCEKLRDIDSAIIEYKKYLKLDQDGEQFNIRAQNLMQMMKACEEYEKINETKVIQLNLYLQNDISQRLDEIQVQIDINLQVQSNIQESADRVNKLLYIKKDQLKQVERFIEDMNKRYELMIFSGIPKEDAKQLDSMQTLITQEIRNLKDIKKETIEESSDHYSQYFLKLKQKISNRIFISLSEAKQRMESLIEINLYIKEKILPIVEQKQDMLRVNKQMCQRMCKKSDFITDMSNNCIQLHTTDTYQTYKPSASLISIPPPPLLNQSFSTQNIQKHKLSLIKVQSAVVPHTTQNPPPPSKQKTQTVKTELIKEAVQQLDQFQTKKNELREEYQNSINVQAEMETYVENITSLHAQVGCIIPSLISVQNSLIQEIEKLKSAQHQTHLKFFTVGFTSINLLQDDLEPHFTKIQEILTSYGELQKKSASSSKYSLQTKCQQIANSITHIQVFMKIFHKIAFSKTDYILARQNLLNAIENIDENLTNVLQNFRHAMAHLDEEFLHLPKHYNVSPSSNHKHIFKQQSLHKNNSFISEAPMSESATPSVQYLLPLNGQYNNEYNSNSKNIHVPPIGSFRKISSHYITNHNPPSSMTQNLSPVKNTSKALSFSIASQQLNRKGMTRSNNLIESFSENEISNISDAEEKSSEKDDGTFRTGNLEFQNNAHINLPFSDRYLKIDPNAEKPDYEIDDDFLNSCVD